MENSNFKNKGKLLIVIIILVVLLGGLVFIFANKDNNNGKNENLKEYVIPSDETELTDKNIIADINKKIEYLNTKYYEEELVLNDLRTYHSMGFREYLFEEDFDDNDKLHIVLSLLDEKFEKLTYDITKTNIDKDYKDIFMQYSDEVFTQLSATSLTSLYTNLFSGKPKEYVDIYYCPTYLYDNINNMYFRISECGGASAQNYFLYKDKMTYKDDEIYVYAYYGNFNYDSDDNNNNMFVLYKDLYSKHVFQKNINDIKEAEGIFKKNYKSFNLYKYTFKKDSNNNYYFNNLEKLR